MGNQQKAIQLTGDQRITQQIIPLVINKLEEWRKNGEIHFPKDYSFGNALREAMTICIREGITPDRYDPASICNALFSMSVQGLSLGKKQCYLVPAKNTIQCWRSYMGTVALMQRIGKVKDVRAYCLYEDDVFQTKYNLVSGKLEVSEYIPASVIEVDYSKLRGAFAVIIGKDNKVSHTEIMSMAQIEKSWGMGYAYREGKSKFHKDFTDQAVKKTIINRACKMFVNTSNDSSLVGLSELINEENLPKPFKNEDFEKPIKQPLDFDDTGEENVDWDKIEQENAPMGVELE